MNDALNQNLPRGTADEGMLTALFSNLIVQQTNMALMFLGQVPSPETNAPVVDLDAARMFIDQLDMLEIKTRGNLTKQEQGLLKESLTHLRMIFVKISDAAGRAAAPASEAQPPATAATAPAATEPASPPPAESSAGLAAAEPESKVKYSKKY